jgi:hypothetical protein
MHTFMELSQGNSMYSYPKQTKMSFFFLLQNWRTGGQNWRVWYQWEGEEVGKGCRRVNMVQILCIHVCKWKLIPVESVPGTWGGRVYRRVVEG